MITKQIYSRNLNEALDTLLADRRDVTIEKVFHLIRPAGFKYALPAPTTIAKLLVNRGWTKHAPSPRARAIYVRPSTRRAAGRAA